jgi:DNA-binding HxlR family transcriptional regulator
MSAPVPADEDPILRALDVLRSRSGFLVMREVFYGRRRFDDLARRLAMSPSSLATRLRALVSDGLLTRVSYQDTGARTRHEYTLTERGAALLPALVALLRWGNDHLPATATGTRLELVHASCGAPVRAEVRCGCGHDVALGDFRAVSSAAP